MTTRTQKRSSRPSSTCPSSRHPSPRSPTPGNSAPASSTSTTTSTVIPGSPGTPPPRSISGPPARSTRPGRTLSPPPTTPTPSGSAAGHTPGHAGAVLDQPAGTRNPNELTETVSFDLTDSARPALTRACRADPDEVSTFRAHETRTGPGALYTPGAAVSGGRRPIHGRRLPPLSGRPLTSRYNDPARDVSVTRHQQGFPDSRPVPVLPLTCDRHGWNGGPGAFP